MMKSQIKGRLSGQAWSVFLIEFRADAKNLKVSFSGCVREFAHIQSIETVITLAVNPDSNNSRQIVCSKSVSQSRGHWSSRRSRRNEKIDNRRWNRVRVFEISIFSSFWLNGTVSENNSIADDLEITQVGEWKNEYRRCRSTKTLFKESTRQKWRLIDWLCWRSIDRSHRK